MSWIYICDLSDSVKTFGINNVEVQNAIHRFDEWQDLSELIICCLLYLDILCSLYNVYHSSECCYKLKHVAFSMKMEQIYKLTGLENTCNSVGLIK